MPDSLRSIHVVAGVIADARGRILLTRRTERSDLPGLWEFPGGKLEAGESPEQALARELREELGIDAQVGQCLIEVPQRYPDKRLRLEVRRVAAFSGKARGREGQPLVWVPPERLERYSMPPADKPVVALLRQPERYLRLPEPDGAAGWLETIEAALAQGAGLVALHSSERGVAWAGLVRRALARFGRRRVRWLLQDDADLAQALGIGVQLRGDALAALATRPLASGQAVAACCDGANALAQAQRLGVDFAVVTPGTGAVAPDWARFERLREDVSLPLYVAGCADVAEARRHGAQGVATGFSAG
ncbi:Nudix family hydrolase [Xanthomonas massiliensis]|uniref:Nudix family hydrolase n=1 Tax=Xanthomonas massiliensis TaxID=1720302 RepID=UPI0008256740|nr:Nudix family hydrolase [Xanthomonas massiliensis]